MLIKRPKGHQDNNLEVSFFGKEQKAIGNYSARLARYETRQSGGACFLDLDIV